MAIHNFFFYMLYYLFIFGELVFKYLFVQSNLYSFVCFCTIRLHPSDGYGMEWA